MTLGVSIPQIDRLTVAIVTLFGIALPTVALIVTNPRIERMLLQCAIFAFTIIIIALLMRRNKCG